MSSSQLSSSESNSTWTEKQNKSFENALAVYNKETPDRWHKIANVVGGTTEDEVRRQYHILLEDISLIESGKVPVPKYRKHRLSRNGTMEATLSMKTEVNNLSQLIL